MPFKIILFYVSKQINKYDKRSKMSLKIMFTIELYGNFNIFILNESK